jgi:hypothetical protein
LFIAAPFAGGEILNFLGSSTDSELKATFLGGRHNLRKEFLLRTKLS